MTRAIHRVFMIQLLSCKLLPPTIFGFRIATLTCLNLTMTSMLAYISLETCGTTPGYNYKVNGYDFDQGYYLVDDIYPSWSTFMKKISDPQT